MKTIGFKISMIYGVEQYVPSWINTHWMEKNKILISYAAGQYLKATSNVFSKEALADKYWACSWVKKVISVYCRWKLISARIPILQAGFVK